MLSEGQRVLFTKIDRVERLIYLTWIFLAAERVYVGRSANYRCEGGTEIIAKTIHVRWICIEIGENYA
jgi:hypothetical protein